MPSGNDYHAYQSTSGGSGGGGGCFPWKGVLIFAVIYEILRLAGSCRG